MFQNQESVAKVKTVVKNETDSSFQAMKWCSSTDSETETQYIFNQTIKVEVNCPEMEFSTFPLDTQHCGFYLGDITKTSLMTGDLAVTWLPAQLDTAFLNNLSNSEFTISTTTEGILKEKYEGYSGFEIKMERKATVFIYTYFLPCSLMVVVSWVSFSVKADAIPGRLGLLLTLLLMMINLTNSAAKIIPGSDKICPLIIWIWLSITFVVSALIEYFTILTILKFSKKKVTTKLSLFAHFLPL